LDGSDGTDKGSKQKPLGGENLKLQGTTQSKPDTDWTDYTDKGRLSKKTNKLVKAKNATAFDFPKKLWFI